MRIAEIAADMNLDARQFDVLVNRLHTTNVHFNEDRFRNYYNSM